MAWWSRTQGLAEQPKKSVPKGIWTKCERCATTLYEADLDANGSWYNVPGQGQVWQPTIAEDTDFDPYGYGSWVAYPSVGYVWASGYPWGWTPFHCGHWSYWNGFGWTTQTAKPAS